MDWNFEEALNHYRNQGAPGDQTAVVQFLKEVQAQKGGIPKWMLTRAAENWGCKESLFLAYIRRLPSLRLEDSHTLELCGSVNCSCRGDLADFARALCKQKGIEFRLVPCMRQCGKGPNGRWDGRLYNQTDETLLRRLLAEAGIPER